MTDNIEKNPPAPASREIPNLPLPLRRALEAGDCVLFVGAGVGAHVRDKNGKPAPDGEELARRLADEFGIDTEGNFDLSRTAEVIELRKGRKELETFLRDQLSNLEPDETLRWLPNIRWRAIFTTNYDYALERAYELTARPPQKPVSFSITPELTQVDPRFDVPIYHLHGTFFSQSKPQIVITQSDYVTFRESRRMLFELLKKEFATSTVLYVGYSNRDPNWNTVLTEIRNEFYPSPMPMSFRVAPATSALDAELLQSKGVETLNMKLDEFVSAAAATLKEAAGITDLLATARKQVPTELAAEFEKSPAAILRFLNSWTYVNAADFNQRANLVEFLKGDKPNWGLLARKLYFQRDLEEDLYDELLDFATSNSNSPTGLLATGSAGYGTTTLLLSLATKLVSDTAGPVFLHRPGAPMSEGDVELGTTLFPLKRPFFVIDNGAECVADIASAFHRLRTIDRPACFLIGERINEWRQRRPRLRPKEFEIEPLSDPEIHRLLDFLRANNALNKLQDLKPELQFEMIKRRHRQELLVTMREATEDNSFDAILEDEFRNIGNDLAKRVYLTTCAFYQHGSLLRDGLLAELIGHTVAEMHEETSKETEGVVIYEIQDPLYGRYTARARHRKIAEVVWHRCGDTAEKEQIIQKTLGSLNLNYGLDKNAFEDFVKNDSIVDTLRSLDGKTKFFETACQKDPLSPYVRQHYARMLFRENKPEAALGQIEQAIEMNRDVRVLYHTKGLILTEMAIGMEGQELARRRLVQAEKAFRHGIAISPRDEYSYQGLALLFLKWAKHTATETAEYIAKCEEVISEGLRTVSVREGLWLVSADVQQFLGSAPKYEQALERAVRENPKSVIARYLLGRNYYRNGQQQRAIEILEPTIKEHPDEFRSCLIYARSMLELGAKYSEAIAIVRLSSLYGLKEPRYIAILGGMLYMNSEFSQATTVFEESKKQELSAPEANQIHFWALDPADRRKRLRVEGKVVVVRAGFCLIDVANYPRLLCPGSRWGGMLMSADQKVTVEIAFSARGTIADHPVPA
jgi:tetratricopeptide (TPR) repeat protein